MARHFEFVVEGPPVGANSKEHSANSRRRYQRWIAKVSEAGRTAWSLPPLLTEEVEVRIRNYHKDSYHDVDNVIKPILDALKGGVVYGDDRQVFRVVSERVNTGNPTTVIEERTPLLLEALDKYEELIYIVVFWEETNE